MLMRTPSRWIWPKRRQPPGFIRPCQPTPVGVELIERRAIRFSGPRCTGTSALRFGGIVSKRVGQPLPLRPLPVMGAGAQPGLTSGAAGPRCMDADRRRELVEATLAALEH